MALFLSIPPASSQNTLQCHLRGSARKTTTALERRELENLSTYIQTEAALRLIATDIFKYEKMGTA